jgi:hypothetical protein
VNDDWRVRVTLLEPNDARELVDRVGLRELDRDLDASLHDRVIVSHDDDELFLYAGTREQAEAAEDEVRSLASQNGWEPHFELTHWHPSAEDWEDPDKPLPDTDAERAAEHAAMVAQERQDEQRQGFPDYEVRVECRSRRDAAALAAKLSQESIPSVHRYKYLLVGALDEDSANALADRLRAEAPDGCTVSVEGTVASVETSGPINRYAVFRGIAG